MSNVRRHMNLRSALAATVIAVTACAQRGPALAPVSPPASTNMQAQGPSYAQKIRTAILPHIVLAEPIEGNPLAQVKVTTRPDGEVVAAEVVESSGYPSWDNSVRWAVLKAGRIPLDIGGKVPPVLYITFRPKP